MRRYRVALGDHRAATQRNDSVDESVACGVGDFFVGAPCGASEKVCVRLARSVPAGTLGGNFELSMVGGRFARVAAASVAGGLMVGLAMPALASSDLPGVACSSQASYVPHDRSYVTRAHMSETVTPVGTFEFAELQSLGENKAGTLVAVQHSNEQPAHGNSIVSTHTNTPWSNHGNSSGHANSAWANHANGAPSGSVHVNMVHGDFVF